MDESRKNQHNPNDVLANAPPLPAETNPRSHEPINEQVHVLQSSASTVVALDIEHVAVADDPRSWTRKRKVSHLSYMQWRTTSRT